MNAARQARALLLAGFAVVSAGPALTAALQASKSEALAKELVALMTQKSFQFAAAKDAKEPDRFIAAMHLPGTQLIVISARYSAPQLLDEALAQKKYQDMYLDLNSASMPGTREFVEDVGADGLVARPENDTPIDSFEGGNQKTALSGDWKKLKITEEAYFKSYEEADVKYAAMLTQLIAQLKK